MSPAFYCRALSSDACRRHNDYAKDVGIQPLHGMTGNGAVNWGVNAWCLGNSWETDTCWSRPWRCN